MSALFLGYCNYRTTWNLKSGKIILAIMKDEALGRVSIVYYDKINYTIFEKKQKIRARDDI